MAAGLDTNTIIRQAPMSTIIVTLISLDEAAIDKLEKLISILLDVLVLKVLEIEHYYDLITVLPWDNRFQVDGVMLMAVQASGKGLMDVCHIV